MSSLPRLLPAASLLTYTTLDSATFDARLAEGFFGVIVDVRDQHEWDAGHIPNATFCRNLQQTQDTTPIAGCAGCNVAVYCRTGSRSKQAASVLEANGFTSVYDVLGVTQWQGAGHALVTTPSLVPACAQASSCALRLPPPPSTPPPPGTPAGWPSPPSPPPPSSPPPSPQPVQPPPSTSTNAALLVAAIGGGVGALVLVAFAVHCMRPRRQKDVAFSGAA